MKAILAVVLLLASFAATAKDNQSAREQRLAEFSRSLARLQEKVDAANTYAATARTTQAVGVLTDDAIFRSQPDSGSAQVAKLSEGAQVHVIGKSGEWTGVQLGGAQDDARVGWTKADVQGATSSATSAFVQARIQDAIDYAREMVDNFRNDPFIEISGFSAEAGIPSGISISIDFTFKSTKR